MNTTVKKFKNHREIKDYYGSTNIRYEEKEKKLHIQNYNKCNFAFSYNITHEKDFFYKIKGHTLYCNDFLKIMEDVEKLGSIGLLVIHKLIDNMQEMEKKQK